MALKLGGVQAGAIRQRFLPTAGVYYYCGSASNVSTTSSLGNGTLRLYPWFVGAAVTIDRLFAEVTAAGDAPSTFLICLYADNGSGIYPGALVASGSIATGTTGVKEATVTAASLAPGVYHVGGVVQNVTTTQPTMRICGSGQDVSGPMAGLPGAGGIALGVSTTGVAGAAPATFPAWPATSTGAVPRVGIRTA